MQKVEGKYPNAKCILSFIVLTYIVYSREKRLIKTVILGSLKTFDCIRIMFVTPSIVQMFMATKALLLLEALK